MVVLFQESQTLGGPMLATKLGPAVSQPDAIYIRGNCCCSEKTKLKPVGRLMVSFLLPCPITDNIDGYIVPYFLLVGVVVFLLYVAVRGRKDRILRRDIHNV